MTTTRLKLHQSGLSPEALQWTLAAGAALSLQAATAGVLTVAQGRIWATLDGPHGRREGDHVLADGEQLQVPAGSRLVLEAWPGQQAAATRVAWRSAAPQPGGDGGRFLAALLRLARGTAASPDATFLITEERGLVPATRAFNAESRAMRAQGAMACGDSSASSGAL